MVGAKMDKVYLVRLRKLRGRALASPRQFSGRARLTLSILAPTIYSIYPVFYRGNISTHSALIPYVNNPYVPSSQPKYALILVTPGEK